MTLRLLSWCEASGTGVSLRLVVQPRSSRTEVVGLHGDSLKIRLAAPPVDGEANEELIGFLAKRLKVARSLIEVRAGASSKRKIVFVDQIAANVVQERLCGR